MLTQDSLGGAWFCSTMGALLIMMAMNAVEWCACTHAYYKYKCECRSLARLGMVLNRPAPAASLVLCQAVVEALSCGGKLAQLVTYHLFRDRDGDVVLAVVHEKL